MPLRRLYASEHPELLAPHGGEPDWLNGVWNEGIRQIHRSLHFGATGRYVRQQVETFNSRQLLAAVRWRPEPNLKGDWQAEWGTNADIGISQTVAPLIVQPGVSGPDLATITITVRNGGPDAAAATVTDILPAGLTFVSAAPGQGACTPRAPGCGMWEAWPTAPPPRCRYCPGGTGNLGLRDQHRAVGRARAGSGFQPGQQYCQRCRLCPTCANVRIGLQTIEDNVDPFRRVMLRRIN